MGINMGGVFGIIWRKSSLATLLDMGVMFLDLGRETVLVNADENYFAMSNLQEVLVGR